MKKQHTDWRLDVAESGWRLVRTGGWLGDVMTALVTITMFVASLGMSVVLFSTIRTGQQPLWVIALAIVISLSAVAGLLVGIAQFVLGWPFLMGVESQAPNHFVTLLYPLGIRRQVREAPHHISVQCGPTSGGYCVQAIMRFPRWSPRVPLFTRYGAETRGAAEEWGVQHANEFAEAMRIPIMKE